MSKTSHIEMIRNLENYVDQLLEEFNIQHEAVNNLRSAIYELEKTR